MMKFKLLHFEINKILLFSLLGILLMCSVASATNDIVGDMQVAYIDATQGIPGTMCSVTDTEPYASGLLLNYNETQSCTDIYKDSSLTGKVFCGGFVPAVDTKYAINLSIVSPSSNNNVDFNLPHARVAVRRFTTGNYRITSYYTDDNDALNSTYFSVTAENVTDDKITVNITSNSTSRTNVIECNGQSVITAYFGKSMKNLAYTPLIAPIMWIAPYTTTDSNITTKIYSIEQTIPLKTVTAYGYSNYTGFGLDYPRPDLDANGTAYMNNLGYRGTVWADVKFFNDAGYIDYTNSLLDDYGWELGIHFKGRLTDKSFEAACTDIDTEMAQMYDTFGRYPTSWCSLQNADNETHAAYVYEHYGALWRNGRAGIDFLSNVGNIHSGTMTWWEEIYSRGILYPTFTHQIDIDPAIAYSMTPTEFNAYIDGYYANNVTVVGYEEYFKRNTNQKDAVVTVLQNDEGVIKYNLVTTGYPTNVHVVSALNGWVQKSHDGVPEALINTTGTENFIEQSTGSYTITKLPFNVSSESGTVETTLLAWTTNQKVWTLSSETQQSVTHTIGDFPANTDLQIKRDDINYETVTSNETGYIEWVYDGGFSEHTFSIERHDFNASLTSGAYPLTTQFTTSSDGIDAYYWDFENDGIIDSTKQNPVHTYGQAGNYTVNLTVHTSEGNVSTVKPDYITVENPTFSEDPLAWFNWVFSYLFGRF